MRRNAEAGAVSATTNRHRVPPKTIGQVPEAATTALTADLRTGTRAQPRLNHSWTEADGHDLLVSVMASGLCDVTGLK